MSDFSISIDDLPRPVQEKSIKFAHKTTEDAWYDQQLVLGAAKMFNDTFPAADIHCVVQPDNRGSSTLHVSAYDTPLSEEQWHAAKDKIIELAQEGFEFSG